MQVCIKSQEFESFLHREEASQYSALKLLLLLMHWQAGPSRHAFARLKNTKNLQLSCFKTAGKVGQYLW